MTKINPFKPNSPVPPAMFTGRYDEIVSLENGLHHTKHNQPSNFMITGDRGIGKSSILFYLSSIASGKIETPNLGRFEFIPINITISDKLDISTLLKLTSNNISREIGKTESIRKFLSDSWSFIQRIKIMDSGVNATEQDSEIEIQLDNFSYSLAETCKRITNPERGEHKKDGLIFLLDECDNAAPQLRLGYFLKTVTEALQRQDCNNIIFIIAGLPDTTEKISKSHESSLRIFHHLKIKELNTSERKYVINKALVEGNKINQEQTKISDEALDIISVLSEGYPHFIQQFGYSAFNTNIDGEISSDDVLDGAFKKGGAIDAIGSRYYETDYYDKIKSDEYRQVLAIMAEKMSDWITKSEIRKKFTGDETQLTNALQALTNRKIILKNPSKNGEYRLQQRGFALWIKLFGDRRKDRK